MVDTTRYERLLALTKDHPEAEVQTELVGILREIRSDVHWTVETAAGKGTDDIRSSQLYVVIECKKPGSANPEALSKRNKNNPQETQKDQIERYIQEIRKPNDELAWRGFLTDGTLWWGWNYNNRTRKFNQIRGLRKFTAPESLEEFQEFCERYMFKRFKSGRLPEPDLESNLIDSIFNPRFKELRHQQEISEQLPQYQTKIDLWEKQLKGSGIVPSRRASLAFAKSFLSHSFIVTVSRLIRHYLNNANAAEADLLQAASDGFQGWIHESQEGQELLLRLSEDIRGYRWRNVTKDFLKTLYHALIPADERKEFGEFYTPDYLAREVVEEVLDDDWCDSSIRRAVQILDGKSDDRKFLGVLDPACGSGTFLFHAAKRLCDRISRKHKRLKSRTAEIVAMLVYGVDVHPIAVEMSRATLTMALPESKTPVTLNVALGDSMNSAGYREGGTIDFGVPIETSTGDSFNVPPEIVNHPDASNVIRNLIDSLVNRTDSAKTVNTKGGGGWLFL